MELFSIECTTCQQRLNVRDESAIGEIEICPKCGSMVLVEAPPDWQGTPPDEPPTSVQPPPIVEDEDELDIAAAMPSETEASSQQTPTVSPLVVGGGELPSPSQEADTVDGPIELDAAPSDARPAAMEQPESVPADEPPVAADPTSPPQTGSAEPVLRTDDWTSEASLQRRQMLLVGGAAIAGIVLAVVVVGLLASRRTQPEPDVSVVDGKPGVESPKDTGDGAARDAEGDDQPENETDNETPTAKDDEDEQVDEDTEKPSDPPADEDATSKAKSEPAEDTESKAPVPEPDSKQEASTKNDEKEKLILKPSEDKPDATAMDTAALAKTLDLLAPFTDVQPYTAPQPGEASAKEKAPKLDPAALPAQGPSAPRPEPRDVDVPERLKDEIREIEFPNVPLIDFLRFVTDFSTIPITLDPDALALVSVTPKTLVNVKQKDTVVAKLLSDALTSQNLGYVPLEGHLLVTRPPLPDGQPRSHTHSVADLVGNDPQQLARLAAMITEMVEPHSWQVNGGVGVIHQKMPELEFEHRDVELFRAMLFCDRLRMARGLPPQSKFPKEVFTIEPRLSQAKKLLETPVTINYVQPTLFVRILARLSKETGLQIIVDWRAVAELGWSPDGEATISASNEPIGQALAEMLLPMDLTYRVINANTVQVTSPSALVARLDVEFYPAKDVLLPQEKPAAFLEHIRKELGLRDIGAAVYLDDASKHLIAALPQPWHKELVDLLNRRKGKPAAAPKKKPTP